MSSKYIIAKQFEHYVGGTDVIESETHYYVGKQGRNYVWTAKREDALVFPTQAAATLRSYPLHGTVEAK